MKTFLIILLISLIWLAGCSSTHQISRGQASFYTLNRELAGKTGEIVLADGNTLSAKYINITEDSVCWVEFTSMVEKGSRYIIILWQEKEIRLDRSEYNYRGATNEGKQYIVVPKYISESKFQKSEISEDSEKDQPQEIKIKDKSYIHVEFTSVVGKGSGYIIILWQEKDIVLDRSEYNDRGTTKEGQQYIVVPKYIYESKFK